MLSHHRALGVGCSRALTVVILLTALAPVLASAQLDCTGTVSGEGEATYYAYTGYGTCSFGAQSNPMLAAINAVEYSGSGMCGRWVHVTGPLGSVDVKIVDQCPECPAGDLDLNQPAFEQIAALGAGRVAITWETIPAPDLGDIEIYIADFSGPSYLEFLVRSHRYGIESMEYLGSGGYEPLLRQSWNVFVLSSSTAVAGPLTLRLTDVHGQVVEVTNIPFVAGSTFTSTVQFPECNTATATSPILTRPGVVLHPALPNPFNPVTELAFELTREGVVSLEIFDMSGRRVQTLVDGAYAAGIHHVFWHGDDVSGATVASGVYIARVLSGQEGDSQRLVLLK